MQSVYPSIVRLYDYEEAIDRTNACDAYRIDVIYYHTLNTKGVRCVRGVLTL